jgi:hypothetical protein
MLLFLHSHCLLALLWLTSPPPPLLLLLLLLLLLQWPRLF